MVKVSTSFLDFLALLGYWLLDLGNQFALLHLPWFANLMRDLLETHPAESHWFFVGLLKLEEGTIDKEIWAASIRLTADTHCRTPFHTSDSGDARGLVTWKVSDTVRRTYKLSLRPRTPSWWEFYSALLYRFNDLMMTIILEQNDINPRIPLQLLLVWYLLHDQYMKYLLAFILA
jgi:hypothetical protein